LAQGQGQGHQSTPQAQGQQTTDTPANGNGGIGGGGEMNLASVLHYLQSEWRRWERDRNEWEIERAEMRVSSFLWAALSGPAVRSNPQSRDRSFTTSRVELTAGTYSSPRRTTSVRREPQG
jgi:hypothetical protein